MFDFSEIKFYWSTYVRIVFKIYFLSKHISLLPNFKLN